MNIPSFIKFVVVLATLPLTVHADSYTVTPNHDDPFETVNNVVLEGRENGSTHALFDGFQILSVDRQREIGTRANFQKTWDSQGSLYRIEMKTARTHAKMLEDTQRLWLASRPAGLFLEILKALEVGSVPAPEGRLYRYRGIHCQEATGWEFSSVAQLCILER